MVMKRSPYLVKIRVTILSLFVSPNMVIFGGSARIVEKWSDEKITKMMGGLGKGRLELFCELIRYGSFRHPLLTYLLTNWALADWSPELFLATNWAPANWASTNWAPRKYWCGKLGHWKIETTMFLPSKFWLTPPPPLRQQWSAFDWSPSPPCQPSSAFVRRPFWTTIFDIDFLIW